MADDDDSLLREVKEEIRREQMEKLWQRYNGLIFGAAALIVLAVGGYKYLETRRIAAEQAAGAEFAAAENLSDDKKKAEAEKAFDKIADERTGRLCGARQAASRRCSGKSGQDRRRGRDLRVARQGCRAPMIC